MKINMQSVGFTASSQLLNYVETKLTKLLRYDDSLASADVYLRQEVSQDGGKVAEISLHSNSGDLFATKQSFRFEDAIDESIDALRRQIEKKKGKLRD